MIDIIDQIDNRYIEMSGQIVDYSQIMGIDVSDGRDTSNIDTIHYKQIYDKQITL